MGKARAFITVPGTIVVLAAGIFVAVEGIPVVSAATFNFTPAAATADTGTRFAVEISLDSGGIAVNSAEGAISFSTRYLAVESISTDVSIFRFWVQEPTFSNAAGTISFGGGLPSPGYNGPNGKIMKIIFRTLGAGGASLAFTSGAILANDGIGTNAFTASSGGSYTIRSVVVSPSSAPVDLTTPQGVSPTLTSPTHPEERQWYRADEVKIEWEIPAGVDGVAYALHQSASYPLGAASRGTPQYAVYDLRELPDGVWYFFARFHSAEGWSTVTRREIRVDRTPPKAFSISVDDGGDATNPHPRLSFATDDETSGIMPYEIMVDGKVIESTDATTFTLPPQVPGEHEIAVRANDRAGNTAEARTTVNVAPLPPPTISEYRSLLTPFAPRFSMAGTANYEFSRIAVTLSRDNEIITLETVPSVSGEWAILNSGKPILSGKYAVTVYGEDARGARSLPVALSPIMVWGWGWMVVAVLALLAAGGLVAFQWRKGHRRILPRRLSTKISPKEELLSRLTILKHDLGKNITKKVRDDFHEIEKGVNKFLE